jgi:hypothetical protein
MTWQCGSVPGQKLQTGQSEAGAHETPFLTENRKGKIRVGFWQIKEFTAALSPGYAYKTAAANSQDGLCQLIATALGILPGIQPG